MDNNVKIILGDGNVLDAVGISYIHIDASNKDYIFYSLNELANGNMDKIYIAEASQNGTTPGPISDEEWDTVINNAEDYRFNKRKDALKSNEKLLNQNDAIDMKQQVLKEKSTKYQSEFENEKKKKKRKVVEEVKEIPVVEKDNKIIEPILENKEEKAFENGIKFACEKIFNKCNAVAMPVCLSIRDSTFYVSIDEIKEIIEQINNDKD